MPRQTKTNVGVIGLGIIGSRVAANLRKSGYQVWVWNRSPRPEPNFLATPAEIAESARIVQIFVSDGPALIETIASLASVLTPNHVVLNHATVSPTDTREAAKMVQDRHARYLDAPFTGSRDAAEAGQLIYYIGGDGEALETAKPILEASAKSIVPVGAIGDAATLKVATNLIAAASVSAYAEALTLLHRGGVPLEKLPEALADHAAGAPLASMKIPGMILDDFEPRFALKHMFKDVQIALGMAAQSGVDLPTAEAFAGAAMSAIQKGHADRDFSVIASLYGYPDRDAPLDEKFRTSPAEPKTDSPKKDTARRTWNLFGRDK